MSIELPEGFWEIITGIDYQYIASATKFHAVMVCASSLMRELVPKCMLMC